MSNRFVSDVACSGSVSGTRSTAILIDQPPLAYPVAIRSVLGCIANTAGLLTQRRIHLPSQHVGLRLQFSDGNTARVYRVTVGSRRRGRK